MGLFSKSKIDAKTILAYNYFLAFEYIPKALYSWRNNDTLFENAISFDAIAKAHPQYKDLVAQTEVKKSGFNKHPDISIYWIAIPNNKMISEVGLACIAVNPKIKRYLYFTGEFSFGSYAICEPDEEKNHNNTGITVQSGEEFAQYCFKQAIQQLTGTCFAKF